MAIPIAKVATDDQGNNLYRPTGRPVQQALFGRVAEGDDQLAEEIGDSPIGYICNQSIEGKSPCERVEKCFFQLVELEVLVADTLLIDSHPFDSKLTVIGTEPASIELVIGHEDEEQGANRHCQ